MLLLRLGVSSSAPGGPLFIEDRMPWAVRVPAIVAQLFYRFQPATLQRAGIRNAHPGAMLRVFVLLIGKESHEDALF
jgi:hypothetical protein